jgi:hypothetical protein
MHLCVRRLFSLSEQKFSLVRKIRILVERFGGGPFVGVGNFFSGSLLYLKA